MRLLITGGCGFIGSNFIRYVLDHYGPEQVTNIDALAHPGALSTVAGVLAHHPDRYEFFQADIADARRMDELLARHPYYAVINFAAETPADSTPNPGASFAHSNVSGVSILLDCARQHGVKRFLQISTGEVYGPFNTGSENADLNSAPKFTEQTTPAPSSPYAASKAEADRLALAYHQAYGPGALEVIVTRSSRNYGPFQSPEKMIPRMILSALQNQALALPGNSQTIRDWLHVEDHCRALFALLLEGTPGCIYNVGGGVEITNSDIAQLILKRLHKDESCICFDSAADQASQPSLAVPARHSLDTTKLQKELQWQPLHRPERGIAETVDWYVAHRAWWEPLLASSGALK